MRHCLCVLFLCLVACPLWAQRRAVDEIVAWVGESVITRSAIHRYVTLRSGELGYLVEGPSNLVRRKENLHQAALQEMIARQLLLQAARKLGVSIGDAELDMDIRKLALRNGYETPEALRDAVEQKGFRFAELREQRRKDMLERRYRGWRENEFMPVSPKAVRAEYDAQPERYVSQPQLGVRALILLVDDPAARKARKARRNEIEGYRKLILAKHQTLADLARVNTHGPNRAQGGLLTVTPQGEQLLLVPASLPEEVRDTAVSLPVGTVSPVIYCAPRRAPDGRVQPAQYWLFEIEKRKSGRQLPFDEVQKLIYQKLEQEARAAAITREVKRLWETTYVWTDPSLGKIVPPEDLF